MLHHAALLVSDLDRSVAFYGDLLGLRETDRASLDGLGLEQVHLSAGDRHADLVLARRLDGNGPPEDKRELFHLAFELPPTTSIAELVAKLNSGGIEHMGPLEHPTNADRSGVRDALYLRDPDGHIVEVTQDRG